MAQRTTSHAVVALDMRAVRARGLALWVTRSDSELNAQTTLTTVACPFDKARRGVFIRFESKGMTIYATQGKE